MVDPQTSTVLLFKDADKPMHPSSMAKMMTIYILFEELSAGPRSSSTRASASASGPATWAARACSSSWAAR